MPDSEWTFLEGQDHQQYEDAWSRGQPPDADVTEQTRRTTTRRSDQVEITHTVVVWEDLEVDPPGEPVSEFCSRCAKHEHSVRGDVAEAARDHAGYLHWGEHRGVRYRNAHITGIEIKRESFHIKVLPQPPGFGLDLSVPWQPDRPHETVFWSIRDIDRRVDGVIWNEWSGGSCTEDGGYYAGLHMMADTLASALGRTWTESAGMPAVVGNEFLPLLRLAARLRRPVFEVSTGTAERVITLRDEERHGEMVRRVTVVTNAGAFRVVPEA
jgi:hypothetical protein